MALTKSARSKINTLVQQCKKLLFEEVEDQLQQFYGLRPDGNVAAIESLASNDPAVRHQAELLRQRLSYLQSNIPNAKARAKESFAQLVREQAFTILNRLASLRMAEERDIIRESIRQGYNSEGFLVFDELTGKSKTTELYQRYTWYLFAIFDELATDLPAVFDRFSPYALLFPGENTLLKLLDIINEEEILHFREEGQPPINLWTEDETIGWIYQYYNSREEISAMRNASNAPRNSRELAVRNQFFTPRYVVQFLTDNSLGRIWYEMTKGKTTLVDFCQYLVRQEREAFLNEEEHPPRAVSPSGGGQGEEPVFVAYRPLKDPRQISMIDPACGSMHFGLYAFDLYEKIYLECWDHHRELIRPIIDEYHCTTREAYARLIPGLIIRHNIHGVDIDPRAVQIAGLSLWLRAQKSYQRLGLEPADRPAITKANIVCAEPMPGDKKMLQEFLQNIDRPLRPLVEQIWEKMQLAGETGLLLKIEEELKAAIEAAKADWEAYRQQIARMGKDLGVQADLFEDVGKLELREKKALYQNIGEDFFEQAEALVLKALQQYAETATNGTAYQKHLFAEDTARGFAFIDLCRKRYDVVLMNPPFGEGSKNTGAYYKKKFPFWAKNILCCFFGRMLFLLQEKGKLGAIFDRTVIIKSTYEGFRIENLIGRISLMLDTGWDVLEANVETTTVVLDKRERNLPANFIDVRESKGQLKAQKTIETISLNSGFLPQIKSDEFLKLPNSVIGYDWSNFFIKFFNENKNLENLRFQARSGNHLKSEVYLRLYWEVLSYNRVERIYNGGQFSMFYFPYRELALYGKDGYYARHHPAVVLRNLDYHFLPGVGYGKRGEILDAHPFKEKSLFTQEGIAISGLSDIESLIVLSFLNSSVAQRTINLYAGQHKHPGYVNLLPLPTFKNFDYDRINLILKIKRRWFTIDETVLEFRSLLSLFLDKSSISAGLNELQLELKKDKKIYMRLVSENDKYWYKMAEVPEDEIIRFEDYKKKRPIENLISIDGLNDNNVSKSPVLIKELISNIFGILFARWDYDKIQNSSDLQNDDDFFAPLPYEPIVALKEFSGEYPCRVITQGIGVDDSTNDLDVVKMFKNVLRTIWGEKSDEIEKEICGIGSIKSLEEFIRDYNGFFDFHLERYTKNRRVAPIYWPISTPSSNYTIWLYYPTLNDQTLYQIVNDFINPKLEATQKEIQLLSQNEAAHKQLNELKGLSLELEAFKAEILRIAQLPYQPNHDDGVLITAAPLHRLFRHNKWNKATEACWRKLEAGEYDWAHLAYSIWPERVREKCKKDLSLAIAHGLEDICEVQPKETKKRKKKTKSKDRQLKTDLDLPDDQGRGTG